MNHINFFEMETIIQSIIERVNCPKCDSEFTPEDLSIMGSNAEKCMVSGFCHSCNCPLAITVNVSRANQQMEGEVFMPASECQQVDSITEQTSYAQVSAEQKKHEEDKQFWQNFDGNFKELFVEEK